MDRYFCGNKDLFFSVLYFSKLQENINCNKYTKYKVNNNECIFRNIYLLVYDFCLQIVYVATQTI